MPINQSAIVLLDQLKSVVSQMTNEQFSLPIKILSNASIGGHVRHSLEFFLCLSDATLTRKINYDHRNHDQCIEQDTILAISIIESIQHRLGQEDEDFPLVLQANYALEMEQDHFFNISSSYYRELAYNIEHAIHHMALIKVAIKTIFPLMSLPEHFGVASSTIRYQKSQRS